MAAKRKTISESHNESSSSLMPPPQAEETNVNAYVAIRKTIQQFNHLYNRLFEIGDDQPIKNTISEMRDSNSILFRKNQFGEFPGIRMGHQFLSDGQMAAVGFHSLDFTEVDYGLRDDFMAREEYKDYRFPLASSIIISSWQFAEQVEYNIIISENDEVVENTVLALKNNEAQKIPVRLTRRHRHVDKSIEKIFTYDGLYHVFKCCPEEGTSNRLTYHLKRLENQIITINQDRFLLGHPSENFDNVARLLCKDISAEDPEAKPIFVTNEVDDVLFSSENFTYSKSMVFAENVHKPKNSVGCSCEGSCSDHMSCPCARPNPAYPYLDKDGRLMQNTIPVIYECGAHCGCGSRCQNKPTQRGLEYQLEVFRTQQKGWGVRTREVIPEGAYLGEYIGVIRRDKDADKQLGNEYLFDIDPSEKTRKRRRAKFCIDGERIGNFVRFINHSCEPNLFVQVVLSDHRDINFARIVLFANREIPAMEELTYSYGYKLDRVEVNGEIKKMDCRCGARNCRKRLV